MLSTRVHNISKKSRKEIHAAGGLREIEDLSDERTKISELPDGRMLIEQPSMDLYVMWPSVEAFRRNLARGEEELRSGRYREPHIASHAQYRDTAALQQHMASALARLEADLSTGPLKFTEEELKRVNERFEARHIELEPDLVENDEFQGYAFYFGEMLRRAANGEWILREPDTGRAGVKLPSGYICVPWDSLERADEATDYGKSLHMRKLLREMLEAERFLSKRKGQ